MELLIDDPELRYRAVRSIAFHLSPHAGGIDHLRLQVTSTDQGLVRAAATCRARGFEWSLADTRSDPGGALDAVVGRLGDRLARARRRQAATRPAS